jgi:L-ascorbate metabolism protein UlaG (beta-lactamase superfamily)
MVWYTSYKQESVIMYVTKLGHSCVLVETDDRVALFDPGAWSDRGLIDLIDRMDRIAYTHEHGDHFDAEILRSLVEKFPEAHVVCNNSIAEIITKAGIECIVRTETQCTRTFDSIHDPRLPFLNAAAPEQTGFHFKDMFTHPGDSNNFSETKKVLAMPFVAPWGLPREAIETTIKLKPQYVLPIHDWHYTEDAKDWLQTALEAQLPEAGITVLSHKNGIRHEIN